MELALELPYDFLHPVPIIGGLILQVLGKLSYLGLLRHLALVVNGLLLLTLLGLNLAYDVVVLIYRQVVRLDPQFKSFSLEG